MYKRQRREKLEKRLEPTEHGIELVRAEWPLSSEVVSDRELPPAKEIGWDAETRVLMIDGKEQTLAEPDPASKIYLARNGAKTALSPSGGHFYCNCTVHRPKADGSGWENAPMLAEYDLDAGTWRKVADIPRMDWFSCIDDGRWLRGDSEAVTLLRDLGPELDVYKRQPQSRPATAASRSRASSATGNTEAAPASTSPARSNNQATVPTKTTAPPHNLAFPIPHLETPHPTQVRQVQFWGRSCELHFRARLRSPP